jgi:predicted transcriptional regulator
MVFLVSAYPSPPMQVDGEEFPVQRNRTRVEILVNILNVARGSTLKTHIMYKANLSHRQVDRYLAFLAENGMLKTVPVNGKLRYEVTEKGLEFLKDYSRILNYFADRSL